MNDSGPETGPISGPVAAAIASCAFTVPLALSLSSTSSPRHPRTMLWNSTLREPAFKRPDWLFPVAWTGIEAALATAAYLVAALKQHVKALLAPYKYPRWVEFVEDLPKTASGTIQRFKLRAP